MTSPKRGLNGLGSGESILGKRHRDGNGESEQRQSKRARNVGDGGDVEMKDVGQEDGAIVEVSSEVVTVDLSRGQHCYHDRNFCVQSGFADSYWQCEVYVPLCFVTRVFVPAGLFSIFRVHLNLERDYQCVWETLRDAVEVSL